MENDYNTKLETAELEENSTSNTKLESRVHLLERELESVKTELHIVKDECIF